MFNFIQNPQIRPCPTAIAEHASWMIIAAARRLANDQTKPADKARYAEVGRRMLHAVRSPLSDSQTLMAASPTVPDLDGSALPMIEVIGRYHDDPESGVREAMRVFLKVDWLAAG